MMMMNALTKCERSNMYNEQVDQQKGANMIEESIQIPKSRCYNSLYAPLRALEVGESLTYPPEKLSSLKATAQIYKKKFGLKYSVRKLPNNTVQVWRVA
jgi:hypothetical protein